MNDQQMDSGIDEPHNVQVHVDNNIHTGEVDDQQLNSGIDAPTNVQNHIDNMIHTGQLDNQPLDSGIDDSHNVQNHIDNNIHTDISGTTHVTTPSVSLSDTTSANQQLLVRFTPNGSEQWLRTVGVDFTPKVGTLFRKLDDGIAFYALYAKACGFDIRRHTSRFIRGRVLRQKTIVCNRQGFRENRKRKLPDNTSPSDFSPKKTNGALHRRVKVVRVGCPACIVFSSHEGKFIVKEFHESHNHRLLSVSDSDMLKASRQLSIFHKDLIVHNSKLDLGASKTFRMCKEYTGSYSNIGASLIDFKNFQRDIKCFIGSKDAQLFIDNFKKLSEINSGFYFKFDVDDCNNLRRVFWADAESRGNYKLFGDAISFDPTYGTNKYCMVFTPFTGVDHHSRSVIFGSCLMSNEDEDSFKWAFLTFLDAMGQKEPHYIITDQDPAIKNAIPATFKTAQHRFCMWHIMEKVTEKVGSVLCRDTNFLDRLNAVVWNVHLDPLEFEQAWLEVITEFSLEGNSWLSAMFNLRKYWIPAYFRDLPMGSILRTTQRSESQNSFFKRYQNHFGTLVEFWLRFKAAIDQQRYAQRCLDKDSNHSLPVTVTPLALESHAATVYTHKLFYVFQSELKASLCSCAVGGFSRNDNFETTDVDDTQYHKTFKVTFNPITKDANCSCKLFERKGLLCKHIVWVYSGKGVNRIPNQYILQRWSRNALKPLFDGSGYVVEDFDSTDATNLMLSEVWTEFYATLNVVKAMPVTMMKDLANVLKQFRGKIGGQTKPLSKDQEIALLLGCEDSTNVTIFPPNTSKNKGSGTRLASVKKQCIQNAKKLLRRCANCKQLANHDRRTCKLPFAKKAPETETETETEPEPETGS